MIQKTDSEVMENSNSGYPDIQESQKNNVNDNHRNRISNNRMKSILDLNSNSNTNNELHDVGNFQYTAPEFELQSNLNNLDAEVQPNVSDLNNISLLNRVFQKSTDSVKIPDHNKTFEQNYAQDYSKFVVDENNKSLLENRQTSEFKESFENYDYKMKDPNNDFRDSSLSREKFCPTGYGAILNGFDSKNGKSIGHDWIQKYNERNTDPPEIKAVENGLKNFEGINSTNNNMMISEKDDDFLNKFESQINYNAIQNSLGQARLDASKFVSQRLDPQIGHGDNGYDMVDLDQSRFFSDRRNRAIESGSTGFNNKVPILDHKAGINFDGKNDLFNHKPDEFFQQTGTGLQPSSNSQSALYNQQPFIYDTVSDQPLYVNVRQFNYIRKRKARRDFLDTLMRENRQNGYLHESRHRHAMNRKRAPSGRFLTKAETEALRKNGHNFDS